MTLDMLKIRVGSFKHIVAGHNKQLTWRLGGTEGGKV